MRSALALQFFGRPARPSSAPRVKLPIRLREQRWPRAERRAYYAAISALLDQVQEHVEAQLLPVLTAIVAQHETTRPDAADERIDMTGTLASETVDRIKADIGRSVAADGRIRILAQSHALRVNEFNRKEVSKQLERVIPINLHAADMGLATHIDAFIEDNVRLIKSVSFTQLDDMKGLVLSGARKGLRVEEVRKQIQARFDVTKSRAALIARDQTGKLNGELTQLRHQQVGITRYRWSTSKDERVRHAHRLLDGTVQEWRKAPDVGNGRHEHPGGDYQCRCNAIPIVEDVLEQMGVLDPVQAKASVVALTPPAAPVVTPVMPAPLDIYSLVSGPLDVTTAKATGIGQNSSDVLTVRAPDGSETKGLWKDIKHEDPHLRPGVLAGTYAHREAAVYELDRMLGGEPVVPPTVLRQLNVRGKTRRGSFQAFVSDAKSMDAVEADLQALGPDELAAEPTIRRTFLLDLITANDDRHRHNIMFRKVPGPKPRFAAVAIDNGLTFPENGPVRFIFPVGMRKVEEQLLMLDRASRKMLRKLELRPVAAMLSKFPGITKPQIRETLARIRALQKDPSVLAKAYKVARGVDTTDRVVKRWLRKPPGQRSELTKADLRTIDEIVSGL